MKKTTTRHLLAAAALAALPALMATPASAQYRVGDDGHALDANNRIGSGGYNRGNDVPNRLTGNQIVTGNVTGGREFRGPVGYTDPRAFRGPTAGNPSDRFVRGSSGSPTSFAPEVDLTTPMPYYGDARAVAPPPGFTREGFSGGYVPAPIVTDRLAGDQRLGEINVAPPTNIAPQPGELLLPGPVDPSSQSPTYLSASPLYGVRRWNMDSASDRYFLSNYTNIAAPRGSNVLDDSTILRYRNELNSAALEPTQRRQGSPEQRDQAQQEQGPERPRPLVDAQRLGAPTVDDTRPLPGQFTSPSYSASAADTAQGQRSRLLVPPEQQSTQYAELHRRLERANQDRPLDDAEANRQFQELRRAQQQGGKTDRPADNPYLQTPQGPQPPTGQPQPPRAGAAPQQGPEKQPERHTPTPMPIDSLAKGVEAQGLSNLLKQAETHMSEGKFAAALDQYDAAQQVAPNNPMILLGRANAELGAGFYARAEAHIREAILMDPAILVGQYDLKQFIGQERLQTVVTELKEIARAEQRQTTPVFLLAWIAYNSGSPRQAAAYLDLSEKRVGRLDAIYRVMREIWQLPAAATTEPEETPEVNK